MNENADIEAVSMWVSAGSDSDVCHLLLAPAPSCCISCSTLSKENQRININKSDSKIQSSPFPIHVMLCTKKQGDWEKKRQDLRSYSKLKFQIRRF